MFTGFYTTNKGHQYIAKAMAGSTLVLTKGQFGDGALPEGALITDVTALVSPLADMSISKKKASENCLITTTQFSNMVNGVLLNPFYFMEGGIFGKVMNADGTADEDCPEALLFYANALTVDKADYIPGVLTEFVLNWPLTISAAANVSVVISESLAYPTLAEFNSRVPVKVTAEGTGTAIEASNEELALNDGRQLSITLIEDLGAGATISYNGSAAYPVYNSNGTAVTEKQQVAGSTLNVVFNEEAGCWYIVGGGSVEIATTAEAKTGTNDTKMMTPAKVKTYVDTVLGNVNTILDSINGEVV